MHVLLLSASLYILLNQFNIDTGAFFLPEAGHAFLFVATLHCFQLENGIFSTGSTTVKNHTEANMLFVWMPSSVECKALLLQLICYEKGLNVFH